MQLKTVIISLLLIVIFSNQYEEIIGAKILAIFPSGSNSHLILGKALLKGLAKKGHEVTMLSPFPLSKPVRNYRDIPMRNLQKDLMKLRNAGNDTRALIPKSNNMFTFLKSVYSFGHDLTQLSIEDTPVQELLKSNETFDLLISEIFMNEVFFSFADHFKVPVVGFSSIGASVWSNDHVGNPGPYSICPETFLDYTDKMTFFQRAHNTYIAVLDELLYNFHHLPRQEDLRQKHLPHTKPLSECLKDVSLVFLNSHPSYTIVRELAPNMIEIGGFHVESPKPLSTDLKKILDESINGVIYFSMGGNIQSRNFPESSRKALLEAFSKLKETVLWKWEEEELPGKSKNVIIKKWFPQSDILAHPNLKLFITHGGLLSTIESVTRGVPLLGIPVVADQKLNIRKAELSGFALYLDFNNLTTESVSWALNEVLTNTRYRDNIKKRSAILRDRIVHPLDEAIYWIEYVLRHKGAKHLRSARNDLNRFQYLLFDVIGFILLILCSVIFIAYYVIKKLLSKLLSKFCSKKVKKESDKKKKN